ncbi:heme-binding protein [Oceanibacterium hippocampi]|uniref:Heme-binding protein n=1 Tax=Oceanibacterium hippocampi TaxID=745714 RepID=A0A1Y5T6U6_9PROT|nr:heme-binding protein [Oceanibacterium hippocampi]SLN57243.1 hypothetical protein OCH7691_02495 [Oceanibacterium hippocampi]
MNFRRTYSRILPRLAAGMIGSALALCGVQQVAAQQHTVPAQQALTVAEVQQIIAQAVNEANVRNAPATIAVVDRVGNVLGVFQMNGSPTTAFIDPGRSSLEKGTTRIINGGAPGFGVNNVVVPSVLGAISKAVTGAYLSSSGNAFTTRTASQIVQENFNPGEQFRFGGPLFGVQFSQLPCSDLSTRFQVGPNQTIGPKRAPLGLSADPGGIPLYKSGVVVGGIGVLTDGIYGVDRRIGDFDSELDELVALAGQFGFGPPGDIVANRITVEGKTFRYTDRDYSSLATNPTLAPAFGAVNGVLGTLQNVRGYTAAAAITAGVAYGTAASGFMLAPAGTFPGQTAFLLVDSTGANRYPASAGTDGNLTAAEVTQLITSAIDVARRGRAQIRRPLDSPIQVTVSIVDTNGAILGMARTPDGPIFGTDVSLQKARTAAFVSNTVAGADLNAGPANTFGVAPSSYVTALRTFLGNPNALADGVAFADRSGGNLSRPFFPDGVNGAPNGPLSQPLAIWSPFYTGLQLDLVLDNIIEHLAFASPVGLPTTIPGNAAAADTDAFCTDLPIQGATGKPRVANGLQIFPGSVPIYRGNTLVGGIGVSGDGVDQDDMISFLGLHNAGVILGTGIGNAPNAIRADRLTPAGARLRYVSCPFKPFVNSSDQNVCQGK